MLKSIILGLLVFTPVYATNAVPAVDHTALTEPSGQYAEAILDVATALYGDEWSVDLNDAEIDTVLYRLTSR